MPQSDFFNSTNPTDYYLELKRHTITEKSISGELTLYAPRRSHHGDGGIYNKVIASWDTLELMWNENKRGESCIPLGVFKMGRRTIGGYAERYGKRFGHPYVWEVEGVDNRSEILIHCGNYPRNTKGCILVGEQMPDHRPDYIRNSAKTYKDFFTTVDELMLEKIAGHTFYLVVLGKYMRPI